MKIVESFLSFQGEGKFAGKVAIFFRFGGCNLKCKGFNCKIKSPKTGEILVGCDTIRAVEISHFDYEDVDFEKLLNQVDNLKFSPIVVITGGEPLIFHKNKNFYDFICKLLDRNLEIHFETNGTCFVDFKNYENYKKCYFAISPKLSNSGEILEKRLNYEALKNIKENAKDSFYKFVIDPKNFINLKSEIDEIISKIPNEIYLMPQAKNRQELEQNSQKVAQFAIKFGFNYSDRIHIRIYNDKEKV